MSKAAQATMDAAKRRRFCATSITSTTPARSNINNSNGDGSELVATVRRWGSTFGVFDDGSRTETLWQLLIRHGGRQAFGYHLLTMCREALQNHPNEKVRDTLQLESELHIKILNGAPPQSGPADPDGVGLEAWHPVIYAPTPADGMNMIHFIMQHKVNAGHLLQMPQLIALFPDEDNSTSAPPPWVTQQQHILQATTFKALPPRGRRHVLLQVELATENTEQHSIAANQEAASSEDEESSQTGKELNKSYSITIFGGIYGFRELFDAANIQGGLVPQPDGTKDEYVRHLKVTPTDEGRSKLTAILDQVLLRIPVYLIDQTDQQDDPFVNWLLGQPSVYMGEKSSQST